MQMTSSLNSIISNEVAEEKEQRPWLRSLQWDTNWNAHKAWKNNSSSGAELMRKMLTGKGKLQAAHTGFVPCSPKSLLRIPVTLPHRNMQAWSLSRQTDWIPKHPKAREESSDWRRGQVLMVGEEETRIIPDVNCTLKFTSEESCLWQVQQHHAAAQDPVSRPVWSPPSY